MRPPVFTDDAYGRGCDERGEFAPPYQELVGFTVWDRDEVERWIADHPEAVQKLLAGR